MLAQCWKDKITGFFKIPGWLGPHKITGLIIVWRSKKENSYMLLKDCGCASSVWITLLP